MGSQDEDGAVAGGVTGDAVALGGHAFVELEDVDAVFDRVDEFGQFAHDLHEFGAGEPAFVEGFLPADLPAEQVAVYPGQATVVGDVVGDKVEGAGGVGEHGVLRSDA